MALHQQPLRPRQAVPDRVRTDARDDAFEQLEALRREGRLDDMEVSELSDETGWSPQHLRNVISLYYHDAEAVGDGGSLAVEIPGDVETEPYLRGWIAGYADGRGG